MRRTPKVKASTFGYPTNRRVYKIFAMQCGTTTCISRSVRLSPSVIWQVIFFLLLLPASLIKKKVSIKKRTLPEEAEKSFNL